MTNKNFGDKIRIEAENLIGYDFYNNTSFSTEYVEYLQEKRSQLRLALADISSTIAIYEQVVAERSKR